MHVILASAPVNRLSDAAIHVRDAALGWMLGKPDCTIRATHTGAVTPDIAAALRATMNRLKAQAISPDGMRVNYADIRRSDDYARYREQLLPQLAAFDPAVLRTRVERVAFWINLYNAVVIDAVITAGVTRSVTEGSLGGLRFFRRAGCIVGGQCLNCDDIEHGILRANRGHPFIPGQQFASDDPRRAWVIEPLDARIHFALTCASRSCPPIGIYDASRLDEQLWLAARNFVDQSTRRAGDALEVSALFRWYAGDFGGRAGVLRFLSEHLPNDGRRALIERCGARTRLRYADYDWGLNV
ncbi:MAG: DUF547 domain-containing protein [Anaerolineae bacterium]|nr:DUF547 domain-containing protein [Candidatus Roseilinea sp.]MDW8450356.1 DUF547 domain-containing protein [Anaerolineae bacterium]